MRDHQTATGHYLSTSWLTDPDCDTEHLLEIHHPAWLVPDRDSHTALELWAENAAWAELGRDGRLTVGAKVDERLIVDPRDVRIFRYDSDGRYVSTELTLTALAALAAGYLERMAFGIEGPVEAPHA